MANAILKFFLKKKVKLTQKRSRSTYPFCQEVSLKMTSWSYNDKNVNLENEENIQNQNLDFFSHILGEFENKIGFHTCIEQNNF